MKELYNELNESIIDSTIAERVQRLNELALSEVLQLKAAIEQELEKHFGALKSQGVDLSSPLITEDGFPREDIDVLQVRLTRRYLNMLRNDLRDVIDRSQFLLNDHFQASNPAERPIDSTSIVPFAQIYDILPNGPLDVAGVRESDKLIAIANVNATNHSNLSLLQKTIRENENVPLPIRVLRNQEVLDLTMTPSRQWNGPGLLGARLKLI
ncbi:hypothetical protein HG536_0F03040 [Torulaspora globosa]|uniref:Probable 26S proteasome regulatory subunit p27 n=1 Tax=Torulaspora globosa TaxID=48254 RepID=A0A7G3ZKE3_9SACH|nr:uncharacterized protein HG536_0F03040 [Torulaspora globosa]QLL33979.1 hypothetical protein HG536_0F03040 [Torulaspora globosa]